MKSTKYQLLKGEYEFVCDQLKVYKKTVDSQQKEIEHLKFVMRKYDKYALQSFAKQYGIEL